MGFNNISDIKLHLTMLTYNRNKNTKSRNNNREKLKAIYVETLEYCEKHKSFLELTPTFLHKNIRNQVSSTKFNETTVRVVNMKTVQAIIRLKIDLVKSKQQHKIGVLNMASKKHYGGGVRNGAMAQEEELFRKSDYALHEANSKNGKSFYPYDSHKFTYTPNVSIVRDHNYNLLPPAKFIRVDMIGMSSIVHPQTDRKGNLYPDDLELITEKIHTIFKAAIMNKCTDIILGALGCGAFANPPKVIANIFNTCVGMYKQYFRSITFAIYSTGEKNFDIFNEIIDQCRPHLIDNSTDTVHEDEQNDSTIHEDEQNDSIIHENEQPNGNKISVDDEQVIDKINSNKGWQYVGKKNRKKKKVIRLPTHHP